ncbi:protein ASPARTIC PROTEASE IN GUARD CELL 2 [Silene latifolia]|uniref:protein ASPARTIC PROTEASE IN GUARD CELL 2 n=1 Tax=Silene latifolia TaxID=37657 RepID=UPI003D781D9D
MASDKSVALDRSRSMSYIPFSVSKLTTTVLVFLLLLLLLSRASANHKTTNHVTSYPNYQHLNVLGAIASTKQHPFSDDTKLKGHANQQSKTVISASHDYNNDNINKQLRNSSNLLSLKLKLVHRDHLEPASKQNNHRSRLARRLQRDVTRVRMLVSRVSNTSSSTAGIYDYKVASFGGEVVSGMDEGSGEYFVGIGVGSPARKQYMVIDSGSDIVWVQCQPCNQCYRQSDPVFNPAQSNSYSGVSCSASVCDRVENSGCSHSGRCRYEVVYSDGSFTKGTMAFETVTLGGTTVRNVAIGCGHSNQGMFVGAAGLLGLGSGSMSFVGQLGGQIGGAFSYCLPTRGSGAAAGSLVFGREAMPEGAAWINLVRNPRAPSFYYVQLAGLGVGGTRVPVPGGVFSLAESGGGGMIVDTGTAVTRLPTTAYVSFRDAFVSQTANLPRSTGVSIFDTCYDLGEFTTVRVPTVSFYFADGPILTLPARNFLIPVDETGTFCFAFAPSPSGLSIIGNIQQEGIQISIDGANGYVGFGPNVC